MKGTVLLCLATASTLLVAGSPAAFAAPSKAASDSKPVITKQITSIYVGYATRDTDDRSVTANWVQPVIEPPRSMPSNHTQPSAAIWAGLQSKEVLAQIGTDTWVASPHSTGSYAWYEVFPHPAIAIPYQVWPGDHMTAAVTLVRGRCYEMDLTNHTHRWNFQFTDCEQLAQLPHAITVAEAPTTGAGVLPLADFGKVTFTGVKVNGAPLTNYPLNECFLVDSHGKEQATPGGITAGGSAFSVQWKSLT